MKNDLDQKSTPLLHALITHQGLERISAHVPGHKNGRGLSSAFARYAGLAARLDATELPGLDDLHHPAGVIEQAQQLAAQAFGSDETYFLVAGSTGGNLASILAVVDPFDVVLVGRNAHQSVWNALELAHAQKVAVTPQWDQYGIVGGLSPDAVQHAIALFKGAKALVVTSPTYDGLISDLPRIVQLAHEADMIVIVDEAHGVHLPFHHDLPVSGIAAGADIVVHSAHKMGTGFTQTGLLHVQGPRVDRQRLQRMLRMVQSSSPSYLLMASLDAMRSQLACCGEQLLDCSLQDLHVQKRRLQEIGKDIVLDYGSTSLQDPFKWIVQADALQMSGWELERALREGYGIYSEYAAAHHVLLAWSYANSAREMEKAADALLALGKDLPDAVPHKSREPNFTARLISDLMPPLTRKERDQGTDLPLQEAVGYRAADSVTVYPPGIPLLLPGERFRQEHIEILTPVLDNGNRVDGVTKDGCYKVRCLPLQ